MLEEVRLSQEVLLMGRLEALPPEQLLAVVVLFLEDLVQAVTREVLLRRAVHGLEVGLSQEEVHGPAVAHDLVEDLVLQVDRGPVVPYLEVGLFPAVVRRPEALRVNLFPVMVLLVEVRGPVGLFQEAVLVVDLRTGCEWVSSLVFALARGLTYLAVVDS